MSSMNAGTVTPCTMMCQRRELIHFYSGSTHLTAHLPERINSNNVRTKGCASSHREGAAARETSRCGGFIMTLSMIVRRDQRLRLLSLLFLCTLLTNINSYIPVLGYRSISLTAFSGDFGSSFRPDFLVQTRQGRRHCARSEKRARLHSSVIPSAQTPLNVLGNPICEYHELSVPTKKSAHPLDAPTITVQDLTPSVRQLLQQSGLKQGTVTVISRHTTTAITINESESRLARDMEQYLLQLAPPDERTVSVGDKPRTQSGVRYLHNDISLRPESEEEKQRCLENGWDIHNPEQLQAWRDQEPINAHSHLLSMLLGSSESIPVVNFSMVIGQWQSILLVDLDPGPRDYRTVGVQLTGYQ